MTDYYEKFANYYYEKFAMFQRANGWTFYKKDYADRLDRIYELIFNGKSYGLQKKTS